MVRALLEGRKTQTRRIMKPQPIQNGFGPPDPVHDIPCYCDAYPPSAMLWPDENGGILNGDAGSPWHGVDRLWVKETYFPVNTIRHEPKFAGIGPDYIYRADYEYREPDRSVLAPHHWKPSIFCTRKASRITLEILDVEAERLHRISEADAMAEGVLVPEAEYAAGGTARNAYRSLWESINGRGSWALNPWVWVIKFKVCAFPISATLQSCASVH